MKKNSIFYVVVLCMMSLAFFACGGDDDVSDNGGSQGSGGSSSSFTSLKGLQVNDLEVDASQKSTSVNITSGSLTGCQVVSTASWCVAEIAGSKVNLQIQENTSDDDRTSTITLTQPKDNSSLSFKVIQSKNSVIQVEKDVYEISEDGGTISISVKSNVEYTVDLTGYDWITMNATTRALQSSTITLSVQANNTGSDREAVIKISSIDGSKSANVTIKQNSISITVSPSSVTMHYDETKQLTATPSATSWSVEDDFIATVDGNGLVTARHIGSTNVIASRGGSQASCRITVTPEYTAYDTPIIAWGASPSTIRAAETHAETSSSSSSMLIYNYTFGSYVCVLGYTFKENALNGILAMMSYSSALYLRIGYYLIERYQPIGKEGNDYYFVDAMEPAKITTAVVFGLTKSGSTNYITVTYMPYTTSSSPAMSKIKSLKQNYMLDTDKIKTQMEVFNANMTK